MQLLGTYERLADADAPATVESNLAIEDAFYDRIAAAEAPIYAELSPAGRARLRRLESLWLQRESAKVAAAHLSGQRPMRGAAATRHVRHSAS